MATRPKRCRYVFPEGHERAGHQCGTTFGISRRGLCFPHDPERAEEAAAARGQGGAATKGQRRRPRPRSLAEGDLPGELETAADAARWSSWATRAQAIGLIDARMAGQTFAGLKTFMAALDKAGREQNLEQRLAELEERWSEERAQLLARIAELEGAR